MAGYLPPAPPNMRATCDPWVYIEEQERDYVRYRCLATGERWEVFGTCTYLGEGHGPCMDGAVDDRSRGDRAYWANPGPPEGRLDIPVSSRFFCEPECHSPMVIRVLPSMQDIGERLPMEEFIEQENRRLALEQGEL